ncbi:MAG: LytR/AlgR family response regulator transcription factor [Candidatus Ventricola sp.]
MVLPTILYGLDEDVRSLLFSKLSQISRATETPFQIQLCTDDIDEAIGEIRDQKSVMLMVLGVDSVKRDRERLALRFGKYAMRINRDHYVVYIVKERSELEQVLPLCARSAGILTCPPEEKAIEQTFTPLFEDYRRVYGRETSQDGRWLNLKTEGRMYRVRMSDVCTVQAINKEIEFRTMKQSFRIYSSMSAVEKMLDESFIRCHRSYFINSNRIAFVDFREMTIHMMDGSSIPLARSFKESISSSLLAQQA